MVNKESIQDVDLLFTVQGATSPAAITRAIGTDPTELTQTVGQSGPTRCSPELKPTYGIYRLNQISTSRVNIVINVPKKPTLLVLLVGRGGDPGRKTQSLI